MKTYQEPLPIKILTALQEKEDSLAIAFLILEFPTLTALELRHKLNTAPDNVYKDALISALKTLDDVYPTLQIPLLRSGLLNEKDIISLTKK